MIDVIIFRELKGVEYVYVMKYIYGKELKEVLIGLVDVIKSLIFFVMMYWVEYDFEYICFIYWIVVLLDDEVILFEILDVKIGRVFWGYCFLGEDVIIVYVKEYEEKLNE